MGFSFDFIIVEKHRRGIFIVENSCVLLVPNFPRGMEGEGHEGFPVWCRLSDILHHQLLIACTVIEIKSMEINPIFDEALKADSVVAIDKKVVIES
jgi:hypothetical protein